MVMQKHDPVMADDNKQTATKFRVPDAGNHGSAPRGPVEPPPERVGSLLRRKREQKERTIADVAAELNIRAAYIEALEQGRFDKLPGKAYAIGFLRSYAEYLTLDSKDLVRRFKDEITGLGQGSQLVFPTPVPESRLPGGALILVSLILFAGAYGAWSVLTRDGSQLAELVPAVPDHLQELVARADPLGESSPPTAVVPQNMPNLADSGQAPAPAAASPLPETLADIPLPAATPEAGGQAAASLAQPAPQPVDGQSDPVGSQPAAPAESPLQPAPAAETPAAPPASLSPTTNEAAAADEPPAALAAPLAPSAEPVSEGSTGLEGATATPPEAPRTGASDIPAAPDTTQLVALPEPSEPRVYGLSNVGSRVTLQAKQDSWIQVREGPDTLLISRVLQAGDSYRVPDRPGILLQTGNAGGIDVEVDGRNLGPFGAVGAVRRDVPLNPDRLIDGSAFRR